MFDFHIFIYLHFKLQAFSWFRGDFLKALHTRLSCFKKSIAAAGAEETISEAALEEISTNGGKTIKTASSAERVIGCLTFLSKGLKNVGSDGLLSPLI